jgi:hypothetical protein
VKTWPLEEWLQEGHRFVHHELEDPSLPVELIVEFDSDYNASVRYQDVADNDVCFR